MESESYRGYSFRGHAIRQQALQLERYVGGGTITRNNKLIETSGVLGVFDTEKKHNTPGSLGRARGLTVTAKPGRSAKRPLAALQFAVSMRNETFAAGDGWLSDRIAGLRIIGGPAALSTICGATSYWSRQA
jgi:hypothetical protein